MIDVFDHHAEAEFLRSELTNDPAWENAWMLSAQGDKDAAAETMLGAFDATFAGGYSDSDWAEIRGQLDQQLSWDLI